MSGCSIRDSVKITCPADLQAKSGRDICAAIVANLAQADVQKQMIKNWSLGGIIDSFKANGGSFQAVINDLRVRMSTLSQADQNSNCENIINQTGTNIIKVGPSAECLKGLSDEVQKKIIESSYVSDVIQTNTQDAYNLCQINLALEALSKMDASIETLTIQEAINEVKGLMASATSSQVACNQIPLDMSACKYITQNQCCKNTINQEQQNIIDSTLGCGGYVKNIVQTNKSNATNDCILQATASITDEIAAKLKLTVTQAADNKAEGLTLNFLIILFAMFIFCVILGPYLLFKYLSLIIIFFIIGGTFLLAGLISLFLYFRSKKSSQTKYNQPYIACLSTRTLNNKISRATLGEVKKRVESKDVIGYDFFMDLPIDNGTETPILKVSDEMARNATDDSEGSVLYITVEPKANDVCEYEDPDNLKTAVVSYIKAKSDVKFLWISIVLFIASIPCIGIGLYKMYLNSKPKLASK